MFARRSRRRDERTREFASSRSLAWASTPVDSRNTVAMEEQMANQTQTATSSQTAQSSRSGQSNPSNQGTQANPGNRQGQTSTDNLMERRPTSNRVDDLALFMSPFSLLQRF